MFGFKRRKKAETAAKAPPISPVRETNHDGANVRDTILTSNVS